MRASHDAFLTNQIATMTEMREPQKVLDCAGGKPVSVMKNSKCVGYFVPAEATLQDDPASGTRPDGRRRHRPLAAQQSHGLQRF